jgi:hypothetical protein
MSFEILLRSRASERVGSVACLFGAIVIAAISGTSILRDFQRYTYQILFTKPFGLSLRLSRPWRNNAVARVSMRLLYTGNRLDCCRTHSLGVATL